MKHYSDEAYRQLFPYRQQTCGGPILPKDNGDHYCAEPHFFEWWYFDVAFTDDSWLVAVLHSASYAMGDHRPAVDLRYYPPGGNPIFALGQFSRKEYNAVPGCLQLSIGESSATEENGVYRLHVRQGLLEAELTFQPKLPGWRVGSGRLFGDTLSGQHFDWVVPVPMADVKGTLSIDGEDRLVTGVGYHDHNWGNIYLPNAFRGWIWGRVWGGKYSLVFADLEPQGDGPRVTPMLLGCDGKVWEVRDGFRLRLDGALKDTNDGAGKSHLFLETRKGSEVNLSLDFLRCMETMQIAALRDWLVPCRRIAEPLFYLTHKIPLLGQVMGALMGRGIYRRWEAHGTLYTGSEEIDVHGLVEEMDFGLRARKFRT